MASSSMRPSVARCGRPRAVSCITLRAAVVYHAWMELTDFKVLTFDCYGTLIDWETGIWHALSPLVDKAGGARVRDAALEDFARHEAAQQQATPAMPYAQLLSAVYG